MDNIRILIIRPLHFYCGNFWLQSERFFCSAAKRSLSYIVGSGGGSGASGGIGVGVPWKRGGGGGGSVLGYYDNPGFKRGSSLTSSINLAADNLDFVINDDDLEPGMHFTSINLSPVTVKQAFEDEILSHLSHYSHMRSTQSQSFLLSACVELLIITS